MSVNKLTLTARYAGQILQNVHHFYIPDQVTGNIATLLANYRDHWLDVMRDNMAAETQFLALHGEEITGSGSGEIADLSLSMVGGGGSDTRVPLELAMVVQLKTGMAGRANRGRFYMFGITCNWLLNGVWNPTNLASAQTRIDTLKGRWTLATGTQIGYLVIHGPNDSSGEFRVVTDMQIRSTPGTQRRRQVGIGI